LVYFNTNFVSAVNFRLFSYCQYGEFMLLSFQYLLFTLYNCVRFKLIVCIVTIKTIRSTLTLYYSVSVVAYFSSFEKIKVGLWYHVAVYVCVCVGLCIPPTLARQWLGKNALIVARQRLGKNPSIVARERLGRNVTAVTNAHAKLEELLDASFSIWLVSYQGK
jgi:hypothetical protein